MMKSVCIVLFTAVILVVLAVPVSAGSSELLTDDACLQLYRQAGRLYQEGDYEAAFPLARDAASTHIPKADYLLAYMYQYGLGTSVDDRLAFAHYLFAAQSGFPQAMHAVAQFYGSGTGTEKNITEADGWIAKYNAASQNTQAAPEENQEGSVQLVLQLEMLCLMGDYETAFPLARDAVDTHIPQVEYLLATMYQYGQGTSVDERMAFAHYLSAAQNGYPPAMQSVAQFYSSGTGTEKNPAEADAWMAKFNAVSQGTQANAEENQQVSTEGSQPPRTEESQLASIQENQAEDPYIIGMLDAGYRIYYQKAVPPFLNGDYAAAFPYALEAADMRVPEAENMMGFMYQNGLGTAKDLDEAFYYYYYASVDGAFASPFNLSQFYAQGIGTDKDLEKAEYWMKVYEDIQANPPERNQIISKDETAVISGSRRVLIPDIAELFVNTWQFQDQFAYLAHENNADDYYILKCGSENRLLAVFLGYTNMTAYPQVHDEYITNIFLEADIGQVLDRDFSILQLTSSKSGYVDTGEAFLLIQPGEYTTLAFVFPLLSTLEQSDTPLTFNLRFNGNPITFILR